MQWRVNRREPPLRLPKSDFSLRAALTPSLPMPEKISEIFGRPELPSLRSTQGFDKRASRVANHNVLTAHSTTGKSEYNRSTLARASAAIFDSLKPKGLGPILGVVNKIGTGTYGNLDYGSAIFASFNNSLLPPFTPKSEPNVAFLGLGGTLLNGLPTGSVGITPITTIKPAGGTKSFNLDSMYIACVLNTQAPLVGVRTACGVTVTGKDINGKDLPSQSLEWGPEGVEPSPMQYWKLNGIVNAKEVTIKITSSISQALTGLGFDNVKYCVNPY
ncbi:hypothetical protein AC578_6131 [Pseudocercospora eumusae]|uniref:Uncharacterized protein n=1 Tax=Pseudocercospora eumusae TaxID=321146 RepID=A0A139GXP1_9PEZI|nr:hypothetical protein AC578_6131 [Pseudocercospora eumusae]